MSSTTVFHLEIPKRGAICALGQEPLTPGMEIHSTLTTSIDEGVFIRQDFCLSCWEKHAALDLKNVRSTWKSKIPSKKEASDLPKQRDARAMCLLKASLLSHEADDHAEAFVLALYLARKRLIYFRQDMILEDGQKAAIYEVAQTEEMLCIRKFSLSSLQIEKIQSNLAAKFKA